jgi:hypothetical protein
LAAERRMSCTIRPLYFRALSFNRTWWSGKLPLTVARCLAHAEVEFPVAVSGVVFAGLGSGYGIGLFYANRSGV